MSRSDLVPRMLRLLAFAVAVAGPCLACTDSSGTTPPVTDSGTAVDAPGAIKDSPDAAQVVQSGCASPDRLCDANQVEPCATLGATWSGGTAGCRSDCSGFDISTCTRALPAVNRELVRPADRDPRWATARCNDGTPFAFQVRLSKSGTSRIWVIGLEGGGACDDDGGMCSDRVVQQGDATTTLGPDRDLSPLMLQPAPGPPQLLTGPFNTDDAINPVFADANHVWAHYCSSDNYSGATSDLIPTSGSSAPDGGPGSGPGWYFSGRLDVQAMLQVLVQRYGLDDSDPGTGVLLIGQSAGGAGWNANADGFASLMPTTVASGRTKLVLDGAWAADIVDPTHHLGTGVSDRVAAERSYDFWKSRLNGRCEAVQIAAGKHKGDCFLGAVGYPGLTEAPPAGLGLPVLVAKNAADPLDLLFHGVFDPADPFVATYKTLIRTELSPVKWVFSAADPSRIGAPFPLLLESPFHEISSQSYSFDDVTKCPACGTAPTWTAGNGGKSFRDVLYQFWADSSVGNRFIFDTFDNIPTGG